LTVLANKIQKTRLFQVSNGTNWKHQEQLIRRSEE